MSGAITPAVYDGNALRTVNAAAQEAVSSGKSYDINSALRVSNDPTGLTYVSGLPINANGELFVVGYPGAAPLYARRGLLFDSSGALVTVVESAAASPLSVSNGVVVDANGAVVVSTSGGLWLDFLVSSLDPRVSFSRASNATMFDSAGNLVWAPHNLHRFSSDPSNWAVSGSTVVQNDEGGPFAGATVGDVYDTETSAIHTLNFSAVAGTYVSGQQVTYSVYLKAGTLSYALIALTSSFTLASIGINLATGEIIAGSGSFDSQSIQNAGNGWWRVIVTATATGTAAVTGTFLTYCSQDGVWGNRAYLGTGVDYIRVSSPQVELTDASTPRPYFATSGANAYYGPRLDYNPATLQLRGLLCETARTNNVANIVWSGATAAALTAAPTPIKGWPAQRATWDGGGSSHFVFAQTMTQAGSTVYTGSVYARAGTARYIQLAVTAGASVSTDYANFDLVAGVVTAVGATATASIQDMGDGVFCCQLIYTSVAVPSGGAPLIIFASNTGLEARASSMVTADYFDFALSQHEAGNFASSRIPTFGTAASRASDVSDLTGTAPYSSAGVSAFVAFERQGLPAASTTEATSAQFYFGDSTNWLSCVAGYGNPAQQRIDLGEAGVATSQPSVSMQPIVPFQVYKIAGRFSTNYGIVAANGVLSALDSAVTMPASLGTSRQAIGRGNQASAGQLHGWLREIRIYTQALDDATLQALTS